MTDSFWGAQLRARQIEGETGLTVRQQSEMPLDEWSRLNHGTTPVEHALAAIDAPYEREQAPAQTPAQPVQDPVTGQELDPNSQEYFLQWRAQRQSGGEGVGIMNAGGLEQSKTAVGRSAYSQSNVEPPTRIERAYVQTQQVQGRASLYQGN